MDDDYSTPDKSANNGGGEHKPSPIELAKDNIAFVVMHRLADDFDEEQAQQALEVLNGTRRED
jgi:hypothetical protein